MQLPLSPLLASILASLSLLLASCHKPPDGSPFDSLPASERAALASLLKQAHLTESQLRLVGQLGLDKNPLSIVIDNGHITGLRLSQVGLSDLQAVAQLSSLRHLWLTDNAITSLIALSPLKQLQTLQLAHNQITGLNGLPSNLHTLVISHNALQSLDDMPHMPQLQTLTLDHNQLTRLDGVLACPKLWTLSALHNPLVNADAASSVRSRGGHLNLPEPVAAVALGQATARPAGESPSVFVTQLPLPAGDNGDKLGQKTGQENFDAPYTPQRFDYTGRMQSFTGIVRLGLMGQQTASVEPVTVEMRIQQGRVRLFLADLNGYRYVECTPQTPVRLTGRLLTGLNYYALLQSMEPQAQGLSWRVFR